MCSINDLQFEDLLRVCEAFTISFNLLFAASSFWIRIYSPNLIGDWLMVFFWVVCSSKTQFDKIVDWTKQKSCQLQDLWSEPLIIRREKRLLSLSSTIITICMEILPPFFSLSWGQRDFFLLHTYIYFTTIY